MSDTTWTKLHEHYKGQEWINKPSLFLEEALAYFPAGGRVLELGAGQGQDSRYLAGQGFEVISTDLSEAALAESQSKLPPELADRVSFQTVDMRSPLLFEDQEFDIVYAHLALHYFDGPTTQRIFADIRRVLKPGGVLAFLTNSTSDPEYGGGEEIEPGFFKIGDVTKRYFSVETARHFASDFEVLLADNKGETYKDAAKGIHGLIRFVGRKAAV